MDLNQPWNEKQLREPVLTHRLEPGMRDFHIHIHASGVFTKDPEFWRPLFLGGVGMAREAAEAKEAEAQAWRSRVVVADTAMHFVTRTKHASYKSAQADKLVGLRKGPALKQSIRAARTPDLPISMYGAEQHAEHIQHIVRPTSQGSWVGEGDFDTLALPRRFAVSKTPTDPGGSWQAAMRDPLYAE
jgi:hypothetical protein